MTRASWNNVKDLTLGARLWGDSESRVSEESAKKRQECLPGKLKEAPGFQAKLWPASREEKTLEVTPLE